MNRHDEMADLVAALALHALGDDDRRAVEAHVEECGICADELAHHQETLAWLAELEPVEPVPATRDAVLGAIAAVPQEGASAADVAPGRRGGAAPPDAGRAPRGRTEAIGPAGGARRARPAVGRRRRVAVAAALLVAAVVAGFALVIPRPSALERVASAAAAGDLGQVEEIAEADPQLQIRTVTEGAVTARVVTDGTDAVLATSGLPALTGGRVYQTWLLAEQGPVPVEVLDSSADPGGLLAGGGRPEVGVALSVEPPGGSEQPTDVVLAVPPV